MALFVGMCPPFDDPQRDGSNPDREPIPERQRRGRMAEELAAYYLALRGYKILARNVREGPREIDLIAQTPGWLVLVEVRYRGGEDRGRPEESVGFRKRRDWMRAGMRWWFTHGRQYGSPRFDLVAVALSPGGLSLRHHPNFLLPEGA